MLDDYLHLYCRMIPITWIPQHTDTAIPVAGTKWATVEGEPQTSRQHVLQNLQI